MTKTDEAYLREIIGEEYADYTNDPGGLEAAKRFEAQGFGRVVWDGPAWRFFTDIHNRKAARDWLAAGQV